VSIEGRISVDATFQDRDGGESLNVVSLSASREYLTGKVAVVTGTVGASNQTILTDPTTYRDAAGSVVSLEGGVYVIAFMCSSDATLSEVSGSGYSRAIANTPVVLHPEQGGIDGFYIRTNSGTATYTAVMYGS
jgi:hypothetical protein